MRDFLACQEFYELMQAYRHAPMFPQETVCQRFEAVKEYVDRNVGQERDEARAEMHARGDKIAHLAASLYDEREAHVLTAAERDEAMSLLKRSNEQGTKAVAGWRQAISLLKRSDEHGTKAVAGWEQAIRERDEARLIALGTIDRAERAEHERDEARTEMHARGDKIAHLAASLYDEREAHVLTAAERDQAIRERDKARSAAQAALDAWEDASPAETLCGYPPYDKLLVRHPWLVGEEATS